MPRIKYVGGHDEVEVVGLGAVARGDSADCPADLAKSLLEQADNWQPDTKSNTTKKEG